MAALRKSPDGGPRGAGAAHQRPWAVAIRHLEQPRAELLARNQRRDTSLSNKRLLEMLLPREVLLPTEAHRVSYVQRR